MVGRFSVSVEEWELLTIELFGSFHALKDGELLPDLRLNGANRLLVLLLLNPDRPLQNIWLAEMLWTDTESLDSLRQSIRRLREALGEESWRVKTAANTVWFDTIGANVDVISFDQSINRGDIASIQTAVKLYKGSLLKDWDDTWVRPEREERRERYLDALTVLAENASRNERYLEAARILAKLVDARPKLESGWEQLIEALIKSGARVEAFDVYQKYGAYLKRAGETRNVRLEPSSKIEAMIRQIQKKPTPIPPELMPDFVGYEPIGGAVPLQSPYYVERAADVEVQTAIKRCESIVLIKGPRQIGKTSLLARVLHQARQDGAKVILTDWQKLGSTELESIEAFFLAQAQSISDQLKLDVIAADCFHPKRAPSANFERFLHDRVFKVIEAPIVWGMDEVDRLFPCPFRDSVFGLFRSWHNERAYDPLGPWQRFTLAMAYATEAHLFIQDLNQSPFNVGSRVVLSDFTKEQISDLNRRYGSPLLDEAEVDKLYQLVGGHPYLVRRSLHEMKKRRWSIEDIESEGDQEDGIFSDHLNGMVVALLMDADLAADLCNILAGEICTSKNSIIRLSSAGVLLGNSPGDVRIRCSLYDRFLRRHLL